MNGETLKAETWCGCCEKWTPARSWDGLYGCCDDCAWCWSLHEWDTGYTGPTCHHGACRHEA